MLPWKNNISTIQLTFIVIFWVATFPDQNIFAQNNTSVQIVGQLKDVMWKGELSGKINVDTIGNKSHLYGFGPLGYLRGEILILDGIAYQSTALNSQEMKVEQKENILAPFFAYANIQNWNTISLPEELSNLNDLEYFLDSICADREMPFFFKISGNIDSANIHVVNLPEGIKVRSPEEAHQGIVHYDLGNSEVHIIGFYSRNHQTIFTHHDTNMHLHLITCDLKKMGHLESLSFNPQRIKFFIQP